MCGCRLPTVYSTCVFVAVALDVCLYFVVDWMLSYDSLKCWSRPYVDLATTVYLYEPLASCSRSQTHTHTSTHTHTHTGHWLKSSCYNRNDPTGFAQQDVFCSSTLLGGGIRMSPRCQHRLSSSQHRVPPLLYLSTTTTDVHVYIFLHMKTLLNLADDAYSEGPRCEVG